LAKLAEKEKGKEEEKAKAKALEETFFFFDKPGFFGIDFL